MSSLLVHDISTLLTMDTPQGVGALGERTDAAVVVEDGRVVWIGDTASAPSCDVRHSADGMVVMPGLVDCHTHLAWAGSRADEFRARLNGENYTDILKRGGGILSTVRATRDASEPALTDLVETRLRAALGRGVTTLEVKSGYGLSAEHELKQLRAAKAAAERVGVRIFTTFLGAHTVPAEFRADRPAYVDDVINNQLPAILDDADFIDAYVDDGAFTVAEGRRILSAGAALGLGVRVHAEQVTKTGAARMAASLGALSADHLERIDAEDAAALAAAGTVAVLLPGAMLYLGDAPPPVPLLRSAGVKIAVATDTNPGSSPFPDLWGAATLAVLTMGLTVEEALLGITANAATALGRPDLGRIQVGCPADILLVRPPAGEPPGAAQLVQHFGAPSLALTLIGGASF
jgi:imidazolonepropionase